MSLPEESFHPRYIYDGELNHLDVKPIWYLTEEEIQRRLQDPAYDKHGGRLTEMGWFQGRPKEREPTLPERYLCTKYICTTTKDTLSPAYLSGGFGGGHGNVTDWTNPSFLENVLSKILSNMEWKQTDATIVFTATHEDTERFKGIFRKWGLDVIDKTPSHVIESKTVGSSFEHVITLSWADWSVERFTGAN